MKIQKEIDRKKMYREMIGNYNFKKYKNVARIEEFRRKIKRIVDGLDKKVAHREQTSMFSMDPSERGQNSTFVDLGNSTEIQGNITVCPLVPPNLGKSYVYITPLVTVCCLCNSIKYDIAVRSER